MAAVAALASISIAAAGNDPAHGSPAEWTIMVFMNGKNDLEQYALKDINEMELAGSSNRVNIVVEVGRMAGYDSSDGDWQGVRRYYVKKDADTSKTGSELLQDLEMADMGDWRVLADFGKWAKAAYPARKYMLIVWNHGTGWDKSLAANAFKGISYDDVTGRHIDTPQLGLALKEMGGVDVYGSDACLMQMPEVAYEIKAYARYITGSEEIEPYDGYPYDTFLGAVTANPGMDPSELGRAVVDTYGEHYSRLGKSATQSLLDTAVLDSFATVLDAFTEAAMASGEKAKVKSAAAAAQNYAGYDNRDLWHFLQLYSGSSGSADVKSKAKALQARLDGELITRNRVSGKFIDGNSRGLAAYLPSYYYDKYYSELAWAGNTRWDEFVKWYLAK